MSQLGQVLNAARSYLNDDAGITWTDAILIPRVQEACRELVMELEVHSIPVILEQSLIIVLPANTTSMRTAGLLPSDLVLPLTIFERASGASMDAFVRVDKVTFLPITSATTELRVWIWQQDDIKFLGSPSDREIILRYKSSITEPNLSTDSLGIMFAENYLSVRVAAACFEAIGDKRANSLNNRAATNLHNIIRFNVTGGQYPVRRRGYRSPKRSWPYGERVTVPVGSGGGGGGSAVSTWILPNNLPDGFTSVFSFSSKPKYISFNGLNQFESAGYTVVAVGSVWNVTFNDIDGNIITPSSNADIRAEIA
mgnify:CR=1 FL=1